MGYDYWSEANVLRRINASADYQMAWMERTPMMKRAFELMAAYAAAAKNNALMTAIAQVRNASIVAGAGGLVLTLVVPLAVWAGVFVALGAGYAQAVVLLKTQNFQSGFTQATVAALLKWEWSHVQSRFFKFSADQDNDFVPGAGKITANAYNEGLVAGFLQGAGYSDEARKIILKQLRDLSPTTSKGDWDRRAQIAYVIELAVAGLKGGVFKT